MTATEIGSASEMRGPCSWCDAPDSKLSGFGCPGFHAIFACPACDPRAGCRPTGFKAHRLHRGVGLRAMAEAVGWSATRESAVETGRERLDRLELAAWWAALGRATREVQR
jgi:hypothetical protein